MILILRRIFSIHHDNILLKINIIKAITYFDDIDFEEDIVMVNGEYDWMSIEKRLIEMTKIQDKTFEAFPFPKKNIKNR